MYDFEDRLIIRRKPDGSTINLAYDADGIRIQKTVFDSTSTVVSTTGYLRDTNNLTGYAQVFEESKNTSAGTTNTVYAYGSDLLSQSVLTPGATVPALSYYGYDGLGSVRQLTNASGAVTDTWDYDAFGNVVRRTGTTDNAYLYRGEQFDADMGMYSLRARFYNQSTGRFWNQDSYVGSSGDPASLHKYLYANADPVGMIDPSGNFSGVAELNFSAFAIATIAVIAVPTIYVAQHYDSVAAARAAGAVISAAVAAARTLMRGTATNSPGRVGGSESPERTGGPLPTVVDLAATRSIPACVSAPRSYTISS